MGERTENQIQHETETLVDLEKREYTLEDVQNTSEAFRAFEEMRKKDNAQYILRPGAWYEFAISGSFGQEAIPKHLEKTHEAMKGEKLPGNKEYEPLILNFYHTWKNNLLQDRKTTEAARPKLQTFLDTLAQLPEPTSIEELRNLYKQHQELNDYSAISYQDGLGKDPGMNLSAHIRGTGGAINNPFLHFRSDRKSGYQHEKPQTEVRVYLNPPAEALPELAKLFTELADQEEVPYYFKLIDFSLQKPSQEDLVRSDRMLLYTNKETLPKILKLLNQIRGEHPQWFTDRTLPPLVAKAGEGIGVAEEPSKYQKSKFGDAGTSFNTMRGKLLQAVWKAVMRDIIVQLPDIKPRQRRTIQQIFKDHFPPKEKIYAEQAIQGKLDRTKLNEDGQRALEDALLRTLVDIIPNINPESLLPGVKIHLQQKAKELGVDPNNLAFNLKGE